MSVIEKKNISITFSGKLPALPYEKIKTKILGPDYVLSVSFVSPAQATLLNKTYRKKTYTPNTLSFALSKKSGQLIICRLIARTQASDFGLTYNQYLIYLLIHSMLHLKGLAHGSTMDRLEARYLKYFLQK